MNEKSKRLREKNTYRYCNAYDGFRRFAFCDQRLLMIGELPLHSELRRLAFNEAGAATATGRLALNPQAGSKPASCRISTGCTSKRWARQTTCLTVKLALVLLSDGSTAMCAETRNARPNGEQETNEQRFYIHEELSKRT
jgi:hypothetical protein